MSTLKATNLQHPSAASPNVVMGSTGSVAVAGALTGAGMDLVNKTDFSAVSSVSLNNVFSSAYANYTIIWNATPSASLAYLYFRLRAGGSDNTSSVYSYTSARLFSNNAIDPYGFAQNTSYIGNGGITGYPTALQMTIQGPYLSQPTALTVDGTNRETSTAAVRWWTGTFHDTASAFDGFTIYPGSGTLTGTVRIYGLRNS